MTRPESYVTVTADGIDIEVVSGDTGRVVASRHVNWESLTTDDEFAAAVSTLIDDTTIECSESKPHESIDESHYASLSNGSDR